MKNLLPHCQLVAVATVSFISAFNAIIFAAITNATNIAASKSNEGAATNDIVNDADNTSINTINDTILTANYYFQTTISHNFNGQIQCQYSMTCKVKLGIVHMDTKIWHIMKMYSQFVICPPRVHVAHCLLLLDQILSLTMV